MTMVIKVMAGVGCTSKLVNKNGNGHDTESQDGKPTIGGQ